MICVSIGRTRHKMVTLEHQPAPTPLKDGLKPATGTGSATPAPVKDGPKEPEPDFMKRL